MNKKSKRPTFRMKIGVISDTHVPSQYEQLPEELLLRLSTVDFIIHAGDIEDSDTLRQLQKVKRVVAVSGNMDSDELKSKLPHREVLNVDHYKIGIIHGWGDPHSLPKRMLEEFKSDNVNCVVFGHSHQIYNQDMNGVLMFNPGSPTDTIYAHYRTYGILETSAEGIKGEIIRLYS